MSGIAINREIEYGLNYLLLSVIINVYIMDVRLGIIM